MPSHEQLVAALCEIDDNALENAFGLCNTGHLHCYEDRADKIGAILRTVDDEKFSKTLKNLIIKAIGLQTDEEFARLQTEEQTRAAVDTATEIGRLRTIVESANRKSKWAILVAICGGLAGFISLASSAFDLFGKVKPVLHPMTPTTSQAKQ